MFEQDYKKAMDGIKPEASSVEATKEAMRNERKPRRVVLIRRLAVACLCLAVISLSIFSAFRISDAFRISSKQPVVGGTDGYVYSDTYFKGAEGIVRADKYGDIYKVLSEYSSNLGNLYHGNGLFTDGLFTNDIKGEMIGIPEDAEAAEAPNDNTDPEHSETNNQVSGVQEADVIKNDGRYIYKYLSDGTIVIISASDGKTEIASKLDVSKLTEGSYYSEMLLCDDTLVLLTSFNGYDNLYCWYSDGEILYDGAAKSESASSLENESRTICTFIDVSDRANPKMIGSNRQSGCYNTSRIVGNILYTVSNYYTNCGGSESDSKVYVPEINGSLIDASDIYMAEKLGNMSYTVITSADLSKDVLSFSSDMAILGISGAMYCSENNFYLTQAVYSSAQIAADDAVEAVESVITSETSVNICTDVYRVALNGGSLVLAAGGSVKGTVLNQFSMDESNGYFRIATTSESYVSGSFTTASNVFVLDAELKAVGVSENLGVSERIKSVRFMGDICYVVTFRQTDPLYAIDLTDPAQPKTLSELKIDGFSTYMQSYGENLLLGIGYDADADSGGTTGIKLTMFDTADNTQIFDAATYTFKWDNSYGSSEALDNHKAILVDPGKNIIGFPYWEENYNYDPISDTANYKSSLKYMFFSYTDGSFVNTAAVTLCKDNDAYYYNSANARGLYIGDYAYIVTDGGVTSLSLSEYKVVSQLTYSDNAN